MKTKQEADYRVSINGMPDFEMIPKAALEPIAKKFFENILKEQKEKHED